MKLYLDMLESRLRSFIEGSTLLLPWNKGQVQFSHHLMEALQVALLEDEGTHTSAPSIYTIYIHPDKFGYWKERQEVFDTIANLMQEASLEENIQFDTVPSIRLAEDPLLINDEIRIQAAYLDEKIGHTTGILRSPGNEESRRTNSQFHRANAFLIVNGNEIFPLQLPVINIGRSYNNHLVLDDPRISRNHIQLRTSRGQYVLFDLNSTGGTFINGLRVTQHILKPGDVISLAGLALIYGQDAPSTRGDTGELIPPPPKEGPDSP